MAANRRLCTDFFFNRHKLHFPVFKRGDDPQMWIRMADQNFDYYSVPMECRVFLSQNRMEYEVSTYLKSVLKGDVSWDDWCGVLYDEFRKPIYGFNSIRFTFFIELYNTNCYKIDAGVIIELDVEWNNEHHNEKHDDERNQGKHLPFSGMDHTTCPSLQQSNHAYVDHVCETMVEATLKPLPQEEMFALCELVEEGSKVNNVLITSEVRKTADMNSALKVFDESTEKEGDSANGKVAHTQNSDYIIEDKVFDEISQRTWEGLTILNNGNFGLKTTYEHDHIAWDPGKQTNLHGSKDRLVSALKLFDGILNKERGTNKECAYQQLLKFLFRHGQYKAACPFFTPQDIGKVTCIFVITALGMYDHSLAIQLVFDVLLVPEIILWKVIMNRYRNSLVKGGTRLYVHYGLQIVQILLSNIVSMEEPDMCVFVSDYIWSFPFLKLIGESNEILEHVNYELKKYMGLLLSSGSGIRSILETLLAVLLNDELQQRNEQQQQLSFKLQQHVVVAVGCYLIHSRCQGSFIAFKGCILMNGGTVNSGISVAFSRTVRDSMACCFCYELLHQQLYIAVGDYKCSLDITLTALNQYHKICCMMENLLVMSRAFETSLASVLEWIVYMLVYKLGTFMAHARKFAQQLEKFMHGFSDYFGVIHACVNGTSYWKAVKCDFAVQITILQGEDNVKVNNVLHLGWIITSGIMGYTMNKQQFSINFDNRSMIHGHDSKIIRNIDNNCLISSLEKTAIVLFEAGTYDHSFAIQLASYYQEISISSAITACEELSSSLNISGVLLVVAYWCPQYDS